MSIYHHVINLLNEPMNVFLLLYSTKEPEDAKTSGISSDKEFV